MLTSKSRTLTLISISVATAILSGCGSDSSSSEPAGKPEITSDTVYGQGMCSYSFELEDINYLNSLEALLEQETDFTRSLKWACSQTGVAAGNFATADFTRQSLDINGSLKESYELLGFSYPQYLPGTNNEFLANITLYLTDWSASGITYSSRVRGDISGSNVDIVLTRNPGWKHADFIFNKEEILYLSRDNFDETLDPFEYLLQDIIYPGKKSDLHDLMYSMCALYTPLEKAPFIYNGTFDENNKVENGKIVGTITSTFNDITSYKTEADDSMHLSNVSMSVNEENTVSIKFDAQQVGLSKVYENQIFKCNP